MKIIYNKILPPKGFTAINLFGILFVRSEYKDKISDKILNHEKIHTAQMKELLYIFFYIWYVIEWIIRLFTNTSSAYKSIAFEQEAYDNQSNLEYLNNRKHFCWLKYYKKTSS